MATLAQDIRSGTVLCSADPWVPGSRTVVANGLMSQADANNPAYRATFAIAASFDAQGSSFTRMGSITWVGGGNAPDDTVPPNVNWFPDLNTPPTFVRIEMDLPVAMSIGATSSLQ